MHRVIGILAAISISACVERDGSSRLDSAAGSTDSIGRAPVVTPSTTRDPAVSVVVRDANNRDLGRLEVTETPAGLSLSGTLRGLPPGPHGIHFHTKGACQPPFESAGPHWNPTDKKHGTENPLGPHMGDMANITVADDSSVAVGISTPGGTLRAALPLLDADGAAVVVHAAADDYRTDPSGNSGARIACGVVGASTSL